MVLEDLLEITAAQHCHLCPRQVLGVRMGMLAARHFGLALPQSAKRLLAIVETDGCFADGISAATGCSVGHRTLRVEDYGKVAATFVDTHTEQSIRIVPRLLARERAAACVPSARSTWEAQLQGYQRLSDDELFSVMAVQLRTPVARLVSRPGRKATCDVCGEEIINEREVLDEGGVRCQACIGRAYYTPLVELPRLAVPVAAR